MVGALPNADCNLLHSLAGHTWVCTRRLNVFSLLTHHETNTIQVMDSLCIGEILEMFEKGAFH